MTRRPVPPGSKLTEDEDRIMGEIARKLDQARRSPKNWKARVYEAHLLLADLSFRLSYPEAAKTNEDHRDTT